MGWRKLALLITFLSPLLFLGGKYALAAVLGALPNGVPASSDINLDKGLVGWWKLDGNANDSTPYSNNATAHGDASSSATDRKSRANAAEAFDGTGDYLVTNTAGINPHSGSLSVWVKPSQQNSWGLWQTHDVNSQNWTDWISMFAYSSGTFYFRMGDGTSCCNNDVTFTTSSYIAVNQWSHLVFLWSDSIMEVYVNSVRVAYRNNPTLQNVVDPAARIGWGHTYGMNGSIDDLRIYNRALSAPEVKTLYEQYDPGAQVSDLQKGLVGWWKLDGNANDSTPNGGNGTLVNSPTLVANRKGQANSAYAFNGLDTQITIPDSAALSPTAEVTVSAWVYGSVEDTSYGDGSTVGIVAKDVSDGLGNPPYAIQVTNGTARCFINNPSNQVVNLSSNSALTDNTWQLITCTFDGSTIKVYVDGVFKNSTSQTGPIADTSNVLRIGQQKSGFTRTFNGSIDDVRVYNRVLGADEIQQLYDSYGSSASVSDLQKGLAGYWPLNGNANDATPYSNNGALTNSPSLATDRKGNANSAYSFNGTNSNIVISSTLGLGTTNTTLSCWVYFSSTSMHGPCVEAGVYSTNGYGIGVGSSNFDSNGNKVIMLYEAVRWIPTSTTISTGWHHLAMVIDGSGVPTAYYDGVSAGSYAGTGAIAPTVSIGIGGYSNARYFGGSVDEVRIWKRALSATEIKALYELYK